MKFDVVVGNPPYQDSERRGRGVCSGNTLWDKFVVLADSLLVDDGYLSFVHPSLWRKANHKLHSILKSNQLIYLEIHNESDGMVVFGAATRYDWYILKKTPYNYPTDIWDQNGTFISLDISKWDFIPNCDFNLVKSMLAGSPEERIEIISDSSYHTQRTKTVRHEQDDEYKYPCIYTIPKNEKPKLKWSNTKDRGHFGIPKVVYSTGVPASIGVFIDRKGEYGLTQFSSGVVVDVEDLDNVYKAINSRKFREFCKSLSVGKQEINTKILRLFRRDFWKEFIE